MSESAALTPTGRALEVIELAARSGSITVSEVVIALDIPKQTAHRIFSSLEEMGFLHRALGRGRYMAAPRLIALGMNVLQTACTYSPVRARLYELARLTVGTASLAIQQTDEVLYIDSAVADSPLMLGFQTGRRAPLYCTSSGRIFLSYMDPESLKAYLETGPWQAHTSSTLTDPAKLLKVVREVERNRVAMSESEYVQGVMGAAVPVLDKNGRLVMVLTISVPTARASLRQIAEMIPTMKTTAKRIASILQPVHD